MNTRVLVLIGTRKGMFIAESEPSRTDWRLRGPYCDRRQTMDVNYDPATGTLFAATAGPGGNGLFETSTPTGIWRSSDLGETWHFSDEGLTYGEGGPDMIKVWNVQPTPHGVVYAGVEPAGLFKSADGGATWQHVAGLTNHPSRPDWGPGNGGLCLHSIVVHPTDPKRLWVGTSAAGAFMTEDGGETWVPGNRNVRDFTRPMEADEVNGCVHKLRGAFGAERAPAGLNMNGRDWLYQQNHFGVYRSADAGKSWEEISEGLPSDFGFGLVVHPHDTKTIYVVPLDDGGRFVPQGKAAVWRSPDSGATWTRQDRGLPQEGAFFGVLRDGMASDTLDPAGVYFGTNTGEVWASRDEGDSWALVAGYLPPVLSVETAVIDA